MSTVLYAYHSHPKDINVQSGRPYSIFRRLVRDHKVVVCVYGGVTLRLLSAVERVFASLIGRPQMRGRGPVSSLYIALRVRATLRWHCNGDAAFIFSPTTVTYSRFLRGPWLKVCCVDTLVPGIREYYPNYNSEAYSADMKREREAVAEVDVLIVPSRWAAQQAIDLGYDGTLQVAPFGFNFPQEQIDAGLKGSGVRYTVPTIRFVTIMVDWTRKGGDLLNKLVTSLADEGLLVRVSVIGECKGVPPEVVESPNYEFIGRLDKRDAGDWRTFCAKFKNADYFIMPSIGEAYGMAIPEAYAFGLPVIISGNGGINEFLRRDSTVTFELSAHSDVSYVTALMLRRLAVPEQRDRDRSNALCLSRTIYNWDVFYSAMSDAVTQATRGCQRFG